MMNSCGRLMAILQKFYTSTRGCNRSQVCLASGWCHQLICEWSLSTAEHLLCLFNYRFLYFDFCTLERNGLLFVEAHLVRQLLSLWYFWEKMYVFPVPDYVFQHNSRAWIKLFSKLLLKYIYNFYHTYYGFLSGSYSAGGFSRALIK